jgi:hypothetical protein
MMTDLLDRLVEAHGGLQRWNELQTVTAHLAQGGAEPRGSKSEVQGGFALASGVERNILDQLYLYPLTFEPPYLRGITGEGSRGRNRR